MANLYIAVNFTKQVYIEFCGHMQGQKLAGAASGSTSSRNIIELDLK